MLKALFTSQVRIKLLELYFCHPQSQYYVRELTRLLDEQINSVRRELENLTQIKLLSHKTHNRKKYYKLNHKCAYLKELRILILKNAEQFKKFRRKFNAHGSLDMLLIAGKFIDQNDPFDIFIVGEINPEKLIQILEEFNLQKYKISFQETQALAEMWQNKDAKILNLLKNPSYLKIHSSLDQYLNLS